MYWAINWMASFFFFSRARQHNCPGMHLSLRLIVRMASLLFRWQIDWQTHQTTTNEDTDWTDRFRGAVFLRAVDVCLIAKSRDCHLPSLQKPFLVTCFAPPRQIYLSDDRLSNFLIQDQVYLPSDVWWQFLRLQTVRTPESTILFILGTFKTWDTKNTYKLYYCSAVTDIEGNLI
jgi:hypothetical protein